MSDRLADSYRHCEVIARRTGKNFAYSFISLPVEKRRAMCAIYAFMRRSDDIADGTGNPALASAGLKQWRATVATALTTGRCEDAMLPALLDTVQRYQIEHQYFYELLDGTEMDQAVTRYDTFDELYRYCYHVASVVGLVVLPVFGFKDEAAKVHGEACGIAFQLTNILRDVKEDAQLGRIYLPAKDRQCFGVSDADILNSNFTPAFVELMKYEVARAREFYTKAQPLIGMIDGDSRSTLAVMIGIYSGILDKIERNGFAVFDGRMRLSTGEKLWIVAKNWVKYRK